MDRVEGVSGGVTEGLNEGVKSLLEFIKKNLGLRTPQIARDTGVPLKTVEKRLRKLKDKGDIEFRGSSRAGGYWTKR
ncbi:MAG: winged helix-turn-helix transcriptional regulator [Candidatus Desulfacyla sp.]